MLTENQKLLFENIPKPALASKYKKSMTALTIETSSRAKTNIRTEEIVSSKRLRIKPEDSLSAKIMEMLDPNIKKELIEGILIKKVFF